MSTLKKLLIIVILILIAFGVGYGLEFMKLRTAQQEWAATKSQMQTRISTLESELARAKARESLREVSEALSQVMVDLTEKNFGLALKALDGMKQTFLATQANLDEEWKNKLAFFLPGLEQIKKDAEGLSPDAKKKTEELKNLFDQALKSTKL